MSCFSPKPARPHVLLPMLALASCVAHATDASKTLDTVQVSGQHLSIRKGIAAKREAELVSDGVSADDIGSIPDYGLGEALQRVPGVSMVINNGRGEAQFMSLRGFSPDYNSVLIDGVALPSTETSRRIQSLDVIPASLAQQVDVYKTFNADMGSDAIGGIASLRTRSAFEHPGQYSAVRANLAYWERQRRLHGSGPSGQFEGTFSKTFGSEDRWGLVLSADYFRRDSSSLDTAIDSYGYSDTDGVDVDLTPSLDARGMAISPERFRALTYDNVRQRHSLFGKLEYDDGQTLRAALTGGVFEHRNDEQRRSQFVSRSGDPIVLDLDQGRYAQGSAQVDADHYDQSRQLRYVQFNGSYQANPDGHLDLIVNRAQGRYRQDTREDVFISPVSPQLGYDYQVVEHARPGIVLADPGAYGDPANYQQSYFMSQRETSRTDSGTYDVQYSQNADPSALGWGVRLGLQYRDLEQRYDLNELRYNPSAAVTLSTIGTDDARVCPYADFSCLLLIDPAQVAAYAAAHPERYVAAASNARNSAIGDFSLQERAGAAFLMGVWHGQSTQATLGLRREYQQRSVTSPQPQPLTSTSNYVQQRTDSANRYLLPSANFGWDITPALKLRLAASRTLALPTYADIGQNSTPTVSTTALTLSRRLANPTLRPRQADNLDMSLEWYPDRDAQLSLGLFHKRIRDEIVRVTSTTSETDPGGLSGTYQVTTTQALNNGQAQVSGLEFTAIDTHFDFLPGAWSQLGAMFNLTLLDPKTADIQMADGSLRALPALMESPKRTANASLLYELGSFTLRLSGNYTGRQLISAATDNPVNDRYYDAITTYDAQLAWRFSSRLRAILQAKNLSNARLERVVGADQDLLRERLDNGRAYYLGMDYVF